MFPECGSNNDTPEWWLNLETGYSEMNCKGRDIVIEMLVSIDVIYAN